MYTAAMSNAVAGDGSLSLAISSIEISSVLLISIILKIKDRFVVVNQFSERWGAAGGLLLLYSLLGVESICLILNVIYGKNNIWIGVVTSALLFLGAITGAIIFRKGQGCLCFGAASTSKWLSPVLFGCLFLLSVISFCDLIRNALSQVFVAAISLLIASGYFIGFYSSIKTKVGKKIVVDKASLEMSYAGSSDGLTVFVFTSTSCSICLALMRFIDKISIHFLGLGRFYIDIEGIAAEEDTTFAGCEVLSYSKLKARTLFSIDARPSMVVINGPNAFKYVGFQPCALALSQLISVGSPQS